MTLSPRPTIATAIPAWQWFVIAAALLALQAALLYGMGRLPICACGYVKFWHGVVQSSENSQHIADWYTLLAHPARHPVLRRDHPAVSAIGLAGAPDHRHAGRRRVGTGREFELDHRALSRRDDLAGLLRRYHRQLVVRYAVDGAGFLLARKLPIAATVALGVAFELAMLLHIRDNLTLNILMLIYPFEAIKQWQGGPPIL